MRLKALPDILPIPFCAEFRAGSFYDGPEAIRDHLGSKNAVFDFSKIAKIFLAENLFRLGRDWIPAGRRSQTGGRGGRERAKEGQIRAI